MEKIERQTETQNGKKKKTCMAHRVAPSKPAGVTSEHLPLSLQPRFPRSADSFLRAVYWGQGGCVPAVEAVSVNVPQVCQAKDELRAWLSAGLWRGKQEDDSGETGSQWQVYSVLCSQSMAALTLM